MSIRVIVIGAAVVTIAVAVVTGLVVVQYGGDSSTSEPVATDVLVGNERLRSRNEDLLQQNERLSAENDNLQARVNALQVEGAEQGNLALENQRLRGELAQSRLELAEESARREQLEETIADLRVELARGSRGLVVALLVLAGLAIWREARWQRRSDVPTPPPIRVVGEGTNAIARRTADVPSTRPSGGHRGDGS